MATHRRIIAWIFLAACVLTIAAVLVSIFVDPDRYRSEVISYLEGKTGKQIEVGHLAIIWFPLTIRLDDFGTRNPKPFPSGYFLRAKRIDAAIDTAALLRRRIQIKSLGLYEPTINVVSDPDGLWNFENPPTDKSRQPIPIFALGIIPEVRIIDGQVLGSSLIEPSDAQGPVVFEARKVSATLRQVNFNAFTDLSNKTPSPSLVAEGEVGAASLRFGSVEVMNLKSKLRLLTKQISFTDVDVEADHGRATGELSFDLSGGKPHFSTTANLEGVDVARLLTAFPGGRGKMTGTMEGQIRLSGAIEHTFSPLEDIRAMGTLTVRNGELPTLSANSNLNKMTRFRESADAKRAPSAFSSFSWDVSLANQRISSKQVNIEFYGVAVECAGNLGLSRGGTLDYQGVARVLKKQGFFTNIFAKVMHEAKEENGKLLFPIQVSGTMVSPKFSVTD
jgi:hypothetical protein